MPARRDRITGFTIIELMVTIGIIAILIGLLVPALRGARLRASEIAALSDLRQIGVSIQLYTEDAGGFYPFHTPGEIYIFGPPDAPVGLINTSQNPWDMSYFWPTHMHRVAPWEDHYLTWVGQGRRHGTPPWLDENNERTLHTGYRMSNAFIATPGTWGGPGPARIRPVAAGRVRYPSAKVLHFDAARAYLPLPDRRRAEHTRGLLFADGSARGELDADAAQPVPNTLREREPERYHDTPGGVEGRDF